MAAAFRVVTREGVAAASTRRIAGEANLPPAAVHYCFHSVDELIDALVVSVLAEVAEAVAVALRANGAVENSLRSALRRLWLSYRDDPARQRAVVDLIAHALRRPAAAVLLHRHQSVLGSLAEQFLDDVAARNGTTWRSPTVVLSRLLISTVDGVLLNWLIDRDDASTEAALEWLTATIAADASPA